MVCRLRVLYLWFNGKSKRCHLHTRGAYCFLNSVGGEIIRSAGDQSFSSDVACFDGSIHEMFSALS